MSKEVFESIKAGIEDAIAHAKGFEYHGTAWSYPKEMNESPIRLSKERPTKAKKTKRKKT